MTSVRTRDFSRAPRELEFSADGDTFTCRPAIAPAALQELVELTRTIGTEFGRVGEVFDIIMDAPNAAKAKARAENRDKPLDLYQILAVLGWLVEEYGQRPLEQSETSSSGSQTADSGTPSTDGVLGQELTLLTSPAPAS
jgi:hypothetical protein